MLPLLVRRYQQDSYYALINEDRVFSRLGLNNETEEMTILVPLYTLLTHITGSNRYLMATPSYLTLASGIRQDEIAVRLRVITS